MRLLTQDEAFRVVGLDNIVDLLTYMTISLGDGRIVRKHGPGSYLLAESEELS